MSPSAVQLPAWPASNRTATAIPTAADNANPPAAIATTAPSSLRVARLSTRHFPNGVVSAGTGREGVFDDGGSSPASSRPCRIQESRSLLFSPNRS